ncbi:hypothetical protein G6F37_004163 [Rhizopus arrhizus]|nr:hypothetical protein G6F38_011256 [Rhizopus arrhizus]KAG1160242.1 hypothetical protein G6F37_004163 [Rhizopus arrhizus]
MTDYMETPGRTTLKAYVDANQSLRCPDIKLDIEEAWTETQVQRTVNIQTSRVSAAILKAGGKNVVNLLKKTPIEANAVRNPIQPADPSYADTSNAAISHPTELAPNTSAAEA